jgi:hypothetical protein
MPCTVLSISSSYRRRQWDVLKQALVASARTDYLAETQFVDRAPSQRVHGRGAGRLGAKSPVSMAEWSARQKEGGLNMNAYATTEIRALTAQELDQVAGGRDVTWGMDQTELIMSAALVGAVIGGLLSAIADLIFD